MALKVAPVCESYMRLSEILRDIYNSYHRFIWWAAQIGANLSVFYIWVILFFLMYQPYYVCMYLTFTLCDVCAGRVCVCNDIQYLMVADCVWSVTCFLLAALPAPRTLRVYVTVKCSNWWWRRLHLHTNIASRLVRRIRPTSSPCCPNVAEAADRGQTRLHTTFYCVLICRTDAGSKHHCTTAIRHHSLALTLLQP